MSKRRRKKNNKKQSGIQRDNDYISRSDRLLDSILHFRERRDNGSLPDDNRRFNPARMHYLSKTDGTPARISVAPSTKKGTPYRHPNSNRLMFLDARRVTVCVRRKQRRESLFKNRKIGSGKSIKSVRRLTPDSEIRCK